VPPNAHPGSDASGEYRFALATNRVNSRIAQKAAKRASSRRRLLLLESAPDTQGYAGQVRANKFVAIMQQKACQLVGSGS